MSDEERVTTRPTEEPAGPGTTQDQSGPLADAITARLAERLADAAERKQARRALRDQLAARRDAGLVKRHAAKLARTEGSTAMTTAHDQQEHRALEEFGLRPSQARICPRVVAGRHCRADTGECACIRHHRLLDHGRIWLDIDGRHVLTGEPYEAAGEDIAVLAEELLPLGLVVSLSGRSLWNPGHTVLIRIGAAA